MHGWLVSLFSVLILVSTVCLYAGWESSELGETGIFEMENAPYPHESRAEGHTYNDKEFPADIHYSDSSVAIFIPTGYIQGNTVDLIYYFHGWGNNINKALDKFSLREMVVESGKNVIFVFPEGPKDASDSGLGKLEDENGLLNLTSEVVAKLKSENKIGKDTELGNVILSGHSGAYRGIAHSLDRGGLNDHVSEVYLLDASYANFDYFTNWMLENKSGLMRSIFTAHLAPENAAMMATLSKANEPFAVRTSADLTQEEIKSNRILFVYTEDLEHNETVQFLRPFLSASPLPDRSTD